MVSLQEVEQRLTSAGLRMRYRGRPEVRELCRILLPEEMVIRAIHGRYDNGAALLIATDRRLLMIDKKPLLLNLQDIAYHHISDINFDTQPLRATIRVRSHARPVSFTSRRVRHMRELASLVQQRVTEIRQFGNGSVQPLMQLAFDPTRQMYVAPPENIMRARRTPATFRRRVSRFYPTSLH